MTVPSQTQLDQLNILIINAQSQLAEATGNLEQAVKIMEKQE